jgi:hypothetical protein
MKKHLILTALRPVIFLLLLLSCNKGNQSPSVQTLLQHKWSIASEAAVFPICLPNDRFVYTGVPSDYYDFQANDSVKINRDGTNISIHTPVKVTLYYSLLDDKRILFVNPSFNSHDTIDILRISNDSLILLSTITYSTISQCTLTVVSGTTRDTLWLYR